MKNFLIEIPRPERIGLSDVQLFISERAWLEIQLIAIFHDSGQLASREILEPEIARSVNDFVGSRYFKVNAWFGQQPVHRFEITFETIQKINCPIPTPQIFHLGRLTNSSFAVFSPDERPLAIAYYERRLIEEVRTECGIDDEISAGGPS